MGTKFLILAGGSGCRLWPLSRRLYAKPFLKLFDDRSFLQNAVSRLYPTVSSEDIYIVTNQDSKFIAFNQIRELISDYPEGNILIEPQSLNTCFSIIYATRQFQADDDIYVLPSDQYIFNADSFIDRLLEVRHSKYSGITVFGVPTMTVNRHFGYIRAEENVADGLYDVLDFVEKPDMSFKDRLIQEHYYTNSGILHFYLRDFDAALEQYFPEGNNAAKALTQGKPIDYDKYPPLSIEKALLEKIQDLKMVSLDMDLHDIVSYNDFDAVIPPDDNNNIILSNVPEVVTLNSRNNLIFDNNRQIVTIGADNLVIVDTDDALLVAHRDHTDSIENALTELKQSNAAICDIHKTAYRPWGSYTVLDCQQNYQVKRLVINPGNKISLQYHKHRSETWTIVEGVAEVVCGDDYLTLFPSESVFIPASTKHRLFNPLTKKPLVVIEVQTGDYLGEDDIIRIEDDFKRV